MLTCGTWVKRGVAKERPDKVEIGAEELKELLQDTKEQIIDLEGGDGEDLEDLKNEVITDERDPDDDDSDDEITKEYGLDNYDEEGSEMTGAGMAGLMYYASNEDDPYVDLTSATKDEDEEFLIKEDDNLVVVGKMEEEYSCLDIYVYNENEGSLYVHHDIILSSFPLCVEWLSYDPGNESKKGNMIAVGTMEPDIQIWDLDLVDGVEPAFTLFGSKKKKKKKKSPKDNSKGHSEAVLTLAWNKHATNVLASGSADNSVKLWDMSQGACVHTLSHHTDKVQSIQWHPHEAQSLLTGSFDKTVVLLDCRSPDALKRWQIPGECEKVVWDIHSPCNFYASSDEGSICYFDVRQDAPVYTIHAHEKAVTGLCLAGNIPGCVTTVSADKKLKVWHTTDNKPTCVLSRDMQMGGMNFVNTCPDVATLCAIGGQNDGLRILDIMDTHQGKERFSSSNGVDEKPKTMDIDESVKEALETLSIKPEKQQEKPTIVKRKKKKKKK